MTSNLYSNGNGHTSTLLSASLAEAETHSGFSPQLEEPVQIKGFAVTYDRKFNLGNFQSLAPAITIWVKSNASEGESFDMHHARERVRHMARENVRAQLLRLQGSSEILFLDLPPPADGVVPIFVRTVSVSLVCKVNLGDFHSIAPGYTDWADMRYMAHNVAHSPAELHIALDRMWQSLWANVDDEISRAQGHGPTGAFFGLPSIEVEDLTAAAAPNGRVMAANGSR